MIRSVILTIFSLGIAFVVSANGQFAYAQATAACDPDFETVMDARATMEARREVELAQTIILKPDSVLEYSCFDDRLTELGNALNNMFSDNVNSTRLFNNPPDSFNPSGPYASFLPTINASNILKAANNNGGAGIAFGPYAPGGKLLSAGSENTLNALVYAAMFNFLSGNFIHAYMGGLYSGGGGGGVCQPMNDVWSFAKCMNFKVDYFKNFESLVLSDPRQKPIPCNDTSRAGFWNANILAANPAPGASGGVDPLISHVDKFATSCAGVDPVPTGVRVFGIGPPPDERVEALYDDAVCPAPGCYFDDATKTCKP